MEPSEKTEKNLHFWKNVALLLIGVVVGFLLAPARTLRVNNNGNGSQFGKIPDVPIDDEDSLD